MKCILYCIIYLYHENEEHLQAHVPKKKEEQYEQFYHAIAKYPASSGSGRVQARSRTMTRFGIKRIMGEIYEPRNNQQKY